jgi:photosystem II stability/assembly factor-like uncharacterized protein
MIFISALPARAEWVRVESGTLAWLRSIYFVDANNGWIAGSGGTLLFSKNSGKSWKRAKKFTNDDLRDVHFLDEKHGWLLCDRGSSAGTNNATSYFLRTSDGGENWEPIYLNDFVGRLTRFFFSHDGYGFAVGEGGALWMMADDRKTWKRVELPTRFLYLSGAWTDQFHGVLVGGGGTILYTEDGGVGWDLADVPKNVNTRLNSVFFINEKTGWAVGSAGNVLKTINGGRSWRLQNSMIKTNLKDVVFADSGFGFAIGDKGTLIESLSGGETWSSVKTGVTGPLESAATTGKKLFTVGFGGVIMVRSISE